MKKIIAILLAVVLLLPVFAKADVVPMVEHHNSKVMVEGEVEVHFDIKFYDFDYDLEITYDKDFLEISKDMITLSKTESSIIVNDERQTVKNKFEVTIEEGKIKIKTNITKDQGIFDSDVVPPEINFKFKALKTGKTKISFNGQNVLGPIDAEVSIVENNCTTANKENTTKEEKKDKDLFFYISLGCNAVLLLALIVVATKKSKKKEVAPAVEPVSAPVPEVSQEPTPSEPTENNQDNQ